MGSARVVRLSVTLPREIFNQLEEKRGDVSRSRYVLRALEHFFGELQQHPRNLLKTR